MKASHLKAGEVGQYQVFFGHHQDAILPCIIAVVWNGRHPDVYTKHARIEQRKVLGNSDGKDGRLTGNIRNRQFQTENSAQRSSSRLQLLFCFSLTKQTSSNFSRFFIHEPNGLVDSSNGICLNFLDAISNSFERSNFCKKIKWHFSNSLVNTFNTGYTPVDRHLHEFLQII
jgi:hypothetical protein